MSEVICGEVSKKSEEENSLGTGYDQDMVYYGVHRYKKRETGRCRLLDARKVTK